MTSPLNILEFDGARIHLTHVAGRTVTHELVPIDGNSASFPEQLGRGRLVVLCTRAVCLMGVFRFPCADPAEVRNMAEFQLSRLTPHRKTEMIVDVELYGERKGQALVVAAMVTKDALQPLTTWLARTNGVPVCFALNSQRLLPVATRLWPKDKRKVRIAGLRLENTLSLALVGNERLLLSREEKSIQDEQSVITAFVEYVRRELPEYTPEEAVWLEDRATRARVFEAGDLSVQVQDLSGLVRNSVEQLVFERSPRAFLDLLLAADRRWLTGFDLSPEPVRSRRQQVRWRRLMLHVLLISGLFMAGGFLSQFDKRRTLMKNVKLIEQRIQQNQRKVEELERMKSITDRAEQHLVRRSLMVQTLRNIADSLPHRVRFVEMNKVGIDWRLKGTARSTADIDSLPALFAGHFENPVFEEITRRPEESGSTVTFVLRLKEKPHDF